MGPRSARGSTLGAAIGLYPVADAVCGDPASRLAPFGCGRVRAGREHRAHAVIAALPGEHGREALAIDGKTLRGSRQPTVPAVHLLGALGHEVGLVLTQTPIAAAADEAGALPALVADLILEGRVVTVDAAFTERPVAAAIRAKGGTT